MEDNKALQDLEARFNERFNKMATAFMELKAAAAVPERRYMARPYCSDQTAELDTAHARALAELKNVPKEAITNRSGQTTKYAKVEHCTDYINPIISKFELSIKQILSNNEFGEDILITRLSHKSGQWYESCSTLKLEKGGSNSSPNQIFGGSVTYMRRYTMLAILGIGQTDDPTDTER
jgi:hypothetical protein